ncbi:anti-sigma K factor RskA [Cypionkella aquatica]|uniref:Regulator of SigK n=1 Tax=Cypionkella aquatica TaxID=1756042 RepID=A0AA37U2C6_9RHOB|nr:anti-sigma factor [Cypionkella aquatica]GLS85031.1 anti-sigma K factor RskA [Cypionkella aquatica]
MTSTPAFDLPEDEALAAEYVLGTLDLAERSAAESRLRRDPAFAALVNDWQNRLADLNDDYAEAPAPNLLPQIEARLFPQATAKPSRWLAWIGGAVTAAAIGAAAFMMLPPPAPPAPTMTAEMSAEASPLRYTAAIAGDQLTLTRVAGTDAEAGKDYELWIIEGDKAPVSLGVLSQASVTIPAPKAAAGYVLAITLEPKGGGPDGKPTGPIVAAGPLAEI